MTLDGADQAACVSCVYLVTSWWKYHVHVLTRAQVRQWWVCHHDQCSGHQHQDNCFWHCHASGAEMWLLCHSLTLNCSFAPKYLIPVISTIFFTTSLSFWLILVHCQMVVSPSFKIMFGCLQTWETQKKHHYPPTWQNKHRCAHTRRKD